MDKACWTKSIFSRTFPVLQKLSKSSGYPGWRIIFQCYQVGIVGPVDQGHMGRIFRILCRKPSGAGRLVSWSAPLGTHGTDYMRPLGKMCLMVA